MTSLRVVDTFEIPNELAHELSDLLTKQTIRERLLDRMIQQGDDNGYNAAEEKLMPIVSKIEAIKNKITNEYVPLFYASSEYSWNYNGYEVSGNKVDIMSNE